MTLAGMISTRCELDASSPARCFVILTCVQSLTIEYVDEHEPWLHKDLPVQFRKPFPELDIFPPVLHYGIGFRLSDLHTLLDYYHDRIYSTGDKISTPLLDIDNFEAWITEQLAVPFRVSVCSAWSRDGGWVLSLKTNYMSRQMPFKEAKRAAKLVNAALKCDPPKVPMWYLEENERIPPPWYPRGGLFQARA